MKDKIPGFRSLEGCFEAKKVTVFSEVLRVNEDRISS